MEDAKIQVVGIEKSIFKKISKTIKKSNKNKNYIYLKYNPKNLKKLNTQEKAVIFYKATNVWGEKSRKHIILPENLQNLNAIYTEFMVFSNEEEKMIVLRRDTKNGIVIKENIKKYDLKKKVFV